MATSTFEHQQKDDAAALTAEQLKAASEIINKALPGDTRQSDPTLLGAVLRTLADNYGRIKSGK